MGGFDFEWNGKVYDILTEGGVPFFSNDEERDAFDKWRATPQGVRLFGPVPTDWSGEHYLDDRYPWDGERGHRVDVDERERLRDGEDLDEADIDWCYYTKCRYGCYRHFYVTSDIRACGHCGVESCKQCAEGSFKQCSAEGCAGWVCDEHERCDGCEDSCSDDGGDVGDDDEEESDHDGEENVKLIKSQSVGTLSDLVTENGRQLLLHHWKRFSEDPRVSDERKIGMIKRITDLFDKERNEVEEEFGGVGDDGSDDADAGGNDREGSDEDAGDDCPEDKKCERPKKRAKCADA